MECSDSNPVPVEKILAMANEAGRRAMQAVINEHGLADSSVFACVSMHIQNARNQPIQLSVTGVVLAAPGMLARASNILLQSMK